MPLRIWIGVGATVASLALLAPASVDRAEARLRADFNADGRSDLAIGAPFDGPGGIASGAVTVIYGGQARLRVGDSQFLTQDRRGIADRAEPGDFFGWTMASGDFDGDRRDDLAIGLPNEDVGGVWNAGAVHVLYGGRDHLTTRHDQFLTENTAGLRGEGSETEDRFGLALAAGDFDRDGRDDLAIGAPSEALRGEDFGFDGLVHVLNGGRDGLRPASDQLLTPLTSGIDGARGSRFGSALAAGRFDRNERDDLAIGADFQRVAGEGSAGAVHVVYGSARRLSLERYQLLSEATPGMAGPGAQGGSNFGFRTASGDFDADGRDDLAITVPGKHVDDALAAGAVHVLYGARRGLSLLGDQYLTDNTAGMAQPGAQDNAHFGSALATGRFDGDRHYDLAIGIPRRATAVPEDGAARVLYGGANRLTLFGDQYFTQSTAGFRGDGPAASDQLGFALGAGDFDGDGRDDLAIGEPQIDDECQDEGGAVHVLYGAPLRLTLDGDQFFTQDTPGMAGDGSQPCDAFGFSFASRTP